MTRTIDSVRQEGFSLIELLVALGIFLIVTGAAFTLLGGSQQRYRTESQVLSAFQEARLGLDQIALCLEPQLSSHDLPGRCHLRDAWRFRSHRRNEPQSTRSC
jgi:prepilin-type N-terminal cleavage/methylation domain-containing protein